MNQEQPEQPNDTYRHEFNMADIPEVNLVGHQWMQQGTELVCNSCPFKHGTFIPIDYQLHGIDHEGKPMIRKITTAD